MEDVRKSEKIGEFTTNEKGQCRFAKGNKIGRMKKKGYTIKDLTNTALAYDKTHDTTILKHYIEELMNDNTLLKDFINKYVPTTTKNELTGADGTPIKYIIEKSYEGEDDRAKDNPGQTDP